MGSLTLGLSTGGAFISFWVIGSCNVPCAILGVGMAIGWGISDYCNRLKDERIKSLEMDNR